MFVGSNLVHRAAFAEWLNTGRKDAFKGANLSNGDLYKLGMEPGQIYPYEGHAYQAVRARGAITGDGYILKGYFGAAGRIGNLTGGSTKAVIVTDDTFVKGDLKDGFVFITAGVGVGELRKVLNNDDASGASTITVAKRVPNLNLAATSVPDAYGTAPDATSDYSVVCDWEVVLTSGVGDAVRGVALGAVTDGNWTIICVYGPHVLIRSVGSTDPLVAGEQIVPSATAGTAKGFTTAGTLADEAALGFAIPYDAYSGAADERHCQLLGKFV